MKGSKTRSGAVSVDVCSGDGGFRVKGMVCRARAVGPVTESGVLGSRGAVALPRMPVRDVWSGSPVVLVDDAVEDIATSDGLAADRCHRTGDRLGELKAAVWSRLVVVADVLGEHRFEVSS